MQFPSVYLLQFRCPLSHSGSRHHVPHHRPDAYLTALDAQRCQVALDENLPELWWERARLLHDVSPEITYCGPEALLAFERVEEALEVGGTKAILGADNDCLDFTTSMVT